MRVPDRCPKCGHVGNAFHPQPFAGPFYDSSKDKLRYTCRNCGYAHHAVPLDKRGGG